ncbi:MAG: hypothetical protein K8R36_02785 [Planctomycetales bacterium]|nr:hypothetical protein [Planctomycetales bacterium]
MVIAVAAAQKPADRAPSTGQAGQSIKPKTVAAGEDFHPNSADVKAFPPFLAKGISWLVEAQNEDGGWGSGLHSAQNVRDPHQVKSDPATSAFAAAALIRAGHTLTSGDHQKTVRRATEYLVKVVETAPDTGATITDMTATQPQRKLGPLVDTSMATHYLARVLPLLSESDVLHGRVHKALDKCLGKLEKSQQQDGSWAAGGWAPVLQAANACNAMELAKANGKKVDQTVLDRARNYQQGNVNRTTGRAEAMAGAGVELYSFSGAQRASAGQAAAAKSIVEDAKRTGKLDKDAKVSVRSLAAAGVSTGEADKLERAFASNAAQNARLGDEKLLAGFGNNGGEEFFSYLMTSESLVISGGKEWKEWDEKMQQRLAKIQNADGSWSGHHCITSPVFCTAAVISCLTTDLEAPLLMKIAKATASEVKVTEPKKPSR